MGSSQLVKNWPVLRTRSRKGFMNIHEFQAKQILQKYGIPSPSFDLISSLEELEKLQLNAAVLKVQIHAGGRGKAGGVKIAHNPEDIRKAGKELLGKRIINEQTGYAGMVAHQLLVSPPIDITKEYYLGVVIDRKLAQGVLIASQEGGMDIERLAHESPEKVLTLPIPTDGCLRSYHLLRISKFMGWYRTPLEEQGNTIVNALVKAFFDSDAVLLEINPLVSTSDQKLLALDAKLTIDDNALYRQDEIKNYFDPSQMVEAEARAHQHELAYVSLDGTIGCMVNGAGLAMATMDIIHHYGGSPANFLDVGGGASKEKVAVGFKIILSDPKVKAVLINIFGGIMDCEVLALGIVEAARELEIKVPLVVRMEGTNVDKGKSVLKESGLPFLIATDLADAAQKVIKSIK